METILSLIGVGLLWGATNPFIRKGAKGIERIETHSKWQNFILEVRSILLRVQYWVPFLLNQCGSVLFIYTLQDSPLTAAVPIANSLSFAFTAITGYFLGEQIPGKKILIGTVLVSLGSSLLMYDKIRNEEETHGETNFESFHQIPPDLIT